VLAVVGGASQGGVNMSKREIEKKKGLTYSNPIKSVTSLRCLVLRSKGLKDATCVGWFGDD